ncbi:MAG: PAS domain-containing protein [Epulopiscium sp.]|nr:PAS domain-containing protein [Candidatus Epulonipiscium sp.]
MKKKIFRNLFLVSIFSIITVTGILIVGGYTLFKKTVIGNIQNEAKIIRSGIDAYGAQEYLSILKFNQQNMRMTIIEPDGKVSYDSMADVNNLENHGDRPEVVEAKNYGTGFSKRYSNTFSRRNYYYAIQLDNLQILRISTQISSIYGVFIQIIPYLLGVIILVLICSSIIASHLTQRLMIPIESLTYELDNEIDTNDYGEYDELLPFVQKINRQQNDIKKQIEKLEKERDTIQLITENMKEGLILLDQDQKILAFNPSAISILEIKEQQLIGKKLITLTRNHEINHCASLALQNQNIDTIIQQSGQYYHIYGCGVEQRNRNMGAMLLLVDVTANEMAQKMRKEFTANVSHELRTPITSISGYAEMMAAGMVASTDIQKFASKIYKEAVRMIGLIENIIILSKLDEQIPLSEQEEIDLICMVNNVIDRLQQKADEKQIKIEVVGTPILFPTVSTMMEEIVYNLVDNAIKYNRVGGGIIISICQKEETIEIKVADNGIGISKNEQSRIFERFYRVDKSRSNKIVGTGLGLSIVKHMVAQLGGKISLKSAAGVGTSITLSFPLRDDKYR